MEEKIKVMVLTTSYPRKRGDFAGSFLHVLFTSLARNGVDVVVVAPHDDGIPLKERMDGIRVERFRYMYPPRLQKVSYGTGILHNIKKSFLARVQLPFFFISFFLKALRFYRWCDLIHCCWIPTVLIGFPLSRLFRKKIVVESLEGDMNELLKRRFLRRMITWMLPSVDTVIIHGEDLRENIASLGVNPEKIRSVVVGLDESLFYPSTIQKARKTLHLEQGKTILLSVGRLSPVKGFSILIEAIGRLDEEDRKDLLLLIVGDGPQREELTELIKALRMQDHIQIVGFRPHEELPLFFNACDFFVLASLSGGAVSILEAMACGKPVIATKVWGMSNTVLDGITGILVPSRDPSALSRGISLLLHDKHLRKRMGEKGLEWVRSEFSSHKACMRVLEIYKDLCLN